MKYILLKDNKIIKLISSGKNKDVLHSLVNSMYNYDSILEVPNSFEMKSQADIKIGRASCRESV